MVPDGTETALLRRIDQLEHEVRRLANAHTIYLGDHQALTRLHEGQRIYVDTRDVGIASHLMLEGRWEPWIEPVIRAAIQPGMTMADIGANFGYYTLLASGWVGPSGRVLAVEANPHLFALLQKSVAVNGYGLRTSLHNLAAHAETGELYLQFSHDYSGGGRVSDVGAAAAVRVPAAPLDLLLADWPALNVLKIDVEGAEPNVIAGARSVIGRSPELAIIMEIDGARDLGDLDHIGYLIAQGFTLSAIEPAGVVHDLTLPEYMHRLHDGVGYALFKRPDK